MAGFKFKLQRLLDIRKHLENEKALEVHMAEMIVVEEKSTLEALETEKAELMARQTGDDLVDITLTQMFHDYLRQKNNQIVEQDAKIREAQKKTDEKRRELVQRVQDRKSIELLKEKKYLEFKKEVNKKFAVFENEVALRRQQDKETIKA
ncbi:MAG TPA: hypothetical protein ENJ10_00175 [Caldithrix abyssi]|uniref:Flagellar FliJ protein n=1 Tax=Caldithrix abyssi TaxID=187145 RepID=A0A7V1PTZ2_CALAY|nr:hypothetical protein [Caldithrix abyssi]